MPVMKCHRESTRAHARWRARDCTRTARAHKDSMGYLVIGTSIQPYGRSNTGFRTVFYALNNILTALHAARVMSLTSNLYFNSAAAGSGPAGE